MDEIKVKLTGRFMRMMVSKWISRMIKKHYGYNIDIHIGELNLDSISGETTIVANVEMKLDSDEFKKVVQNIME